MNNQQTGFLDEAPGRASAIRLVFVYGSFWVMLLVSYLAWKQQASPGEMLALFSGMMSVLGGVKIIQKNMEEPAAGNASSVDPEKK